MIRLKIILASTRVGRKGPAVASWILKLAEATNTFDIEFIDLKALDLPFHDEPEMPVLQKYTQEHTKNWSRTINSADAFIIVNPEYNHGYSAPLKNALDYLFKEWNYKPVAFVSYGGIAGGTRAAQMLVQVVTALKMMPLTESVHLPNFSKSITASGTFEPGQAVENSAATMFKELEKWANGLKTLRNPESTKV